MQEPVCKVVPRGMTCISAAGQRNCWGLKNIMLFTKLKLVVLLTELEHKMSGAYLVEVACGLDPTLVSNLQKEEMHELLRHGLSMSMKDKFKVHQHL